MPHVRQQTRFHGVRQPVGKTEEQIVCSVLKFPFLDQFVPDLVNEIKIQLYLHVPLLRFGK